MSTQGASGKAFLAVSGKKLQYDLKRLLGCSVEVRVTEDTSRSSTMDGNNFLASQDWYFLTQMSAAAHRHEDHYEFAKMYLISLNLRESSKCLHFAQDNYCVIANAFKAKIVVYREQLRKLSKTFRLLRKTADMSKLDLIKAMITSIEDEYLKHCQDVVDLIETQCKAQPRLTARRDESAFSSSAVRGSSSFHHLNSRIITEPNNASGAIEKEVFFNCCLGDMLRYRLEVDYKNSKALKQKAFQTYSIAAAKACLLSPIHFLRLILVTQFSYFLHYTMQSPEEASQLAAKALDIALVDLDTAQCDLAILDQIGILKRNLIFWNKNRFLATPACKDMLL